MFSIDADKLVLKEKNSSFTAFILANLNCALPPNNFSIFAFTGTYAIGTTSTGMPFLYWSPRFIESFLKVKFTF